MKNLNVVKQTKIILAEEDNTISKQKTAEVATTANFLAEARVADRSYRSFQSHKEKLTQHTEKKT